MKLQNSSHRDSHEKIVMENILFFIVIFSAVKLQDIKFSLVHSNVLWLLYSMIKSDTGIKCVGIITHAGHEDVRCRGCHFVWKDPALS